MAAQEAVELLEARYDSEEVDEQQTSSAAKQLVALLDLNSSSIPRLQLRKKTASETIGPLLGEQLRVILLYGDSFRPVEGRNVLSSANTLVHNVAGWIGGLGISDEESGKCKVILRDFLDSLITAFCDSIQSSIAQRTFEAAFPRLVVRSAVSPDWKHGEEIVAQLRDSYRLLGAVPAPAAQQLSIPSLILMAHSDTKGNGSSSLVKFNPLVISCVQQNIALDEALSVILAAAHAAVTDPSSSDLPIEVIIPLCTVLPPLASVHPDPPTRHLVFKTLSLILRGSPAQLRLQVLCDLTSTESAPQMRVAAIGLVREAIMEGIATPPSIFASPKTMQVFGRTLFSPDPPDFFARRALGEYRESQEPARLVECLTLYYLLLLRDEDNLTGIRDPSMVKDVEKSLLSPIRAAIKGDSGQASHTHERLQRVDSALETLNLSISRTN
ncbi:hypothetical protein HGRIS_000604 [Hohenbuehelia grisea]|uniref:Uncharacterized protein n=1 Tax=Hohenbuehelia grisea TaxID=104357 RepID=A0ABR3JTF9_9AGAR